METKFIAVDTETFKGKAFLLTWANGALELKNFSTFFNQLASMGKKFVTYNLDYDVSGLLALLPDRIWRKLFVEKEVSSDRYWMRYLPKKMWVVRADKFRFEIYDIWTFFQCSLEDALKKFGSPFRKYHLPQKLLRNLSPAQYRANKAKVDRYAIQDAKATQWLVDELVKNLEAIGLKPTCLYSVGHFAKQYLVKNKISFGKLSRRYEEFARKCYYGARIEVLRRGTWKRVYGYDIRSAYPYALSQLPDFSKSHYFYSKQPKTKFYLAECKIRMIEANFYLLPYRYRETIIFPRFNGETAWVTSTEVNYLLKHKLATVEFKKVLNIETGRKGYYRKFVNKLYRKRKFGGMIKQLFKLILNSLYGVAAETIDNYKRVAYEDAAFAYLRASRRLEYSSFVRLQSQQCPEAARFWQGECTCQVCKDTRRVMNYLPAKRGQRVQELIGEFYKVWSRDGRMSNVTIAAFITAGARVQIFDAMRKAGNSVVSVFTDCIFSTKPLRLPCQEKLGNWEFQGCKKMTIVGAGVYQFGSKIKFRGFKIREKLSKILWKAKGELCPIPQLYRITGMRKVRHRIKTADFSLNELVEDEKELNINFDHKRIWDKNFRNGRDVFRQHIASRPFALKDLTHE